MRNRRIYATITTAALVTAMAATGTAASAASATAPAYRHVCSATAPAGHAECLSLIPTRLPARSGSAAAAPAGLKPSDLRSAYNLAAAAAASGHGRTIAIVDAFDDPKAAADLAVYRRTFHLPACPTAGGCFRKVNQAGHASPLPAASGSTGWATEESLDLDMVSAVCPNCHIILVEADNTLTTNLGAGVDAAVGLGAKFVSNSYGGTEFSGETSADADYDHPGVAVTVSAGDSGFGTQYPAASPFVTSVGGTSLHRDSAVARGWRETVWGNGESGVEGDGTGSGCSAFEPKPSWQHDAGCGDRTIADVSADADPNTGVATYDTYDQHGWLVVGGTSAAAPIIAAVYALAGPANQADLAAQYPYQHAAHLNDVTSGSNGACGTYLCNGATGYDGPTGLGTPDGTGAFKAVDNTVALTSPGRRSTLQGKKITPVQIKAADSRSGQSFTFTARGLPAGLVISKAGKITGTPRTLVYTTVTVTATDNTGASGSTRFSWADDARGAITSGLSARRCVTARGGSFAAGNAIEIAKCNGGKSQRWTIYAGPGREDSIELTAGHKSNARQLGCMAVRNSSAASGARVVTESCILTASLLWKPGGSGHLTGKHSGKCLTDPGAGPNGTRLTITRCAVTSQERWKLP